jgi:ArsR family transcriptional regulator
MARAVLPVIIYAGKVGSVAASGSPTVIQAGAECVPLSLSAPLAREEAEHLARVLKSVSEPTRLQLISLIKAAPDGEACVCDLTEPLGLRQPTVSYHLRVLAEAGLVAAERRGTWMWYSLVPGALDSLRGLLR